MCKLFGTGDSGAPTLLLPPPRGAKSRALPSAQASWPSQRRHRGPSVLEGACGNPTGSLRTSPPLLGDYWPRAAAVARTAMLLTDVLGLTAVCLIISPLSISFSISLSLLYPFTPALLPFPHTGLYAKLKNIPSALPFLSCKPAQQQHCRATGVELQFERCGTSNNVFTPRYMGACCRFSGPISHALPIDQEGKKIWCYVEQLHKLQEKEGLHFANKLRVAHVKSQS